MTVGTDHPPGTQHAMVSAYLARLRLAAANLSPGRREELIGEIRGHIDEAVSESAGDDAAIRHALDRLGAPEDIVAAEHADGYRLPTGATPPFAGPPPPRSPWGTVEVLAVLGLTVGAFVIPIIGPLLGAALAWASSQWTRAEKWIATALAVVPMVLLAVGGAVVITVAPMADGMDEEVPVEPAPSASAPANPGEG
jgi:hypothetical protein